MNLLRLALVCTLLFFVTGLALPDEANRSVRKPNVIVIVTDDQGYADLGVQGVLGDVKTPHIDGLADAGVRCTNGYITSPQCSPSRAGLITGRYQARFGVEEIALCPLPLEEITIAERLTDAGYQTGFVGKWHLDVNTLCANWLLRNVPHVQRRGRGFLVPPRFKARFAPHAQGFADYYDGEMKQYSTNFGLDGSALSQPRVVNDNRFRVDVQSDAAVAFIDKNHSAPFFLHLCYFAPHVPLEAAEKYLSRFPGEMPERRRYGLAMISAVDDGVGRIRKKLKEYEIDRNTLIFFVSDNGAPLKGMRDLPINRPGGAWDGSRNDPLAGEKGTLFEGGIRVPFVVSWPTRLPAGKVYDHPVISLDIAATAMAAAGLAEDNALDGVNIIPHLAGELQTRPHAALFWRFWGQTAVRADNWKLIRFESGRREVLFNLADDLSETTDRLADFPQKAAELRKLLTAWEAEMVEPRPRGGLSAQDREQFKDRL